MSYKSSRSALAHPQFFRSPAARSVVAGSSVSCSYGSRWPWPSSYGGRGSSKCRISGAGFGGTTPRDEVAIRHAPSSLRGPGFRTDGHGEGPRHRPDKRTASEIILPDGRNLNQELVRAGLAWWYERYARRETVLRDLEQEARDAKRGLWVDPKPVAPWEWKKAGRK